MNNCPLCLSNYSASTSLCDNCGFSFERGEISDHGRLRAYLDKLRKSHKWSEEVNLKKRITEYFISKYGRSLPSADSQGWSERKTARLLGETNTHTSNDIRLAKALDKYPELSNYKSKTQAKRRLKQILSLSDYSVIEHEKDLQKYLNTNWDKTPFGLEWELQKTPREGRYDTREVGEIDLLAKHRSINRWLVVELKRDQSSDETVGQALRYMGWVKEHKAGESGEVEGLIISETVDDSIRFALVCVSNSTLRLWKESAKVKAYQPLTSPLAPLQRGEI